MNVDGLAVEIQLLCHGNPALQDINRVFSGEVEHPPLGKLLAVHCSAERDSAANNRAMAVFPPPVFPVNE